MSSSWTLVGNGFIFAATVKTSLAICSGRSCFFLLLGMNAIIQPNAPARELGGREERTCHPPFPATFPHTVPSTTHL